MKYFAVLVPRDSVGASLTVEALQLGASATATSLVDFSDGPLELNLMQSLEAFSSSDVPVQ